MDANSIDALVRSHTFEDGDSKFLSELIVFSHNTLCKKIDENKVRIEKNSERIDCNEDEINNLKTGDLLEKAVRSKRKEDVKYISLILGIIVTFLSILKFALGAI